MLSCSGLTRHYLYSLSHRQFAMATSAGAFLRESSRCARFVEAPFSLTNLLPSRDPRLLLLEQRERHMVTDERRA